MTPHDDDICTRLIAAGWGDIERPRIPAHVLAAAEAGQPVPVYEKPVKPPKPVKPRVVVGRYLSEADVRRLRRRR